MGYVRAQKGKNYIHISYCHNTKYFRIKKLLEYAELVPIPGLKFIKKFHAQIYSIKFHAQILLMH